MRLPASTRVVLPSGAVYQVRPAQAADAPAAAELIHAAFEPWKRLGLRLSPMFQSVDHTRAHLDGKGVVALDADGRLAGTFSLEDGRLERGAGSSLLFHEGADAVPYRPSGSAAAPRGPLLVFKKAAVLPGQARAGLGGRLYSLAEDAALQGGYAGMALETVKEASWLYSWYERLGFAPVGSCRYPESALDTILMIKPLRGAS